MTINTDYGFVGIQAGESYYELAPTFSNISRIGSPSEIVECFTDLETKAFQYVRSFMTAVRVLECCGLPEGVAGYVTISDHTQKMLIVQGDLPLSDVFVLASHCMLHGVVGAIDKEDMDAGKKGEPITTFDAHEYIVSATEHLGVSLTEAGNMTMTQFVKLVKARMRNMKSSEGGSKQPDKVTSEDQIPDLMAWHNERVKALEEKNKERSGASSDKQSDKKDMQSEADRAMIEELRAKQSQ